MPLITCGIKLLVWHKVHLILNVFIYLNCTLTLVESQTKSKVNRDVDQELGQRSTTAGQVPSMRTTGKASKHSHYQNQDLPSVLTVGKMWVKEIMPALLVWAGSLADPW